MAPRTKGKAAKRPVREQTKKRKPGNSRGPTPGHGGRPPKMKDSQDRTIRLDPHEWAAIVKLAPHGSWADRIRQLTAIAKAAKRRKRTTG